MHKIKLFSAMVMMAAFALTAGYLRIVQGQNAEANSHDGALLSEIQNLTRVDPLERISSVDDRAIQGRVISGMNATPLAGADTPARQSHVLQVFGLVEEDARTAQSMSPAQNSDIDLEDGLVIPQPGVPAQPVPVQDETTPPISPPPSSPPQVQPNQSSPEHPGRADPNPPGQQEEKERGRDRDKDKDRDRDRDRDRGKDNDPNQPNRGQDRLDDRDNRQKDKPEREKDKPHQQVERGQVHPNNQPPRNNQELKDRLKGPTDRKEDQSVRSAQQNGNPAGVAPGLENSGNETPVAAPGSPPGNEQAQKNDPSRQEKEKQKDKEDKPGRPKGK